MKTPFILEASANDATKSVTMTALDWELMFDALPGDGLTVYKAFLEVAWVRRCVELRANALSSIPAKVYRAGNARQEAEWEFADKLPRLLWLTSAGLQVYGASYWMRERNRVRDTGYRWLVPTTIRPKLDPRQGLTGFERRIPGAPPIQLTVEELIYFFQPALDAEGGPGPGWVKTILTEAGIAYHADAFASAFFERGAIPALLLSVEGNPAPKELDRLQEWWKRVLSGVKRAWETVAVAATVKPQVVGLPPDALAMPELIALVREQIATAAGVPQTMLEDAANFATAKEHHHAFYTETVVPEARIIEASLNEQLFRPQGLEIVLDYQDLDIFQNDESDRAMSVLRLTQAGLPTALAMQLLGFDLPPDVTFEDVAQQVEAERERHTQRAQAMPGNVQPGATPPAIPLPSTRAMSEDLDRWRRKAISSLKAGGVADVPFVTDAIPDAQQAVLHERLMEAGTEEEVKAAFEPPFCCVSHESEHEDSAKAVTARGEPLAPVGDVTISEEDIERAFAEWNRLMPSEYRDLLGAEAENA